MALPQSVRRYVACLNVASLFFGVVLMTGVSRGADAEPKQVSPIVAAAKAVQDANVQLVAARAGMVKARASVEATFTANPEYAKAKKDLDKATADVTVASRPALNAARNKPEYMAASKGKADAQAQYTALQDDPKHNAAEIDRLGNEIVQDGTLMSKMEREAVEGDPKVLDAKARQDQARQVMDGFKTQLDDAAKNDKDCQAAQQQLEAAQAAVTAAQQNLASTRKSEAEAAKAKAEAAKAAAAASAASGSSNSGSNYSSGSKSKKGK